MSDQYVYSRGRCPTCNSPDPHRHPAVQFEGEVEVCADEFHLRRTNQNAPAYIAAGYPHPATSLKQKMEAGS